MSFNPAQASLKGDKGRTISGTVGATALQNGDLCKISSALFIPLAADDKQLSVFVAQGNYDASAVKAQFVPLADQLIFMSYTGGTPTVGSAYGVTGPRVLDVAETTAKLLEVVEVDTTNEGCWVKEYQLSA